VGSLSCPFVSLCVATGGRGLETSTNPASGVWTGMTVPGAGGLGGISCPLISLCAVGDVAGHVLTSTDPAGGPTAWTSTLADPISCATTPSACDTEQIVASDRTGPHVLDTSTEFEAQTGPELTGLTLTGSTLTWTHSGSSRSAQLTP
jgi:hypothetical protein